MVDSRTNVLLYPIIFIEELKKITAINVNSYSLKPEHAEFELRIHTTV